ncbi:MAG: hypothetical protein NZ703_10525 [Gemmataceae bacterium]|nr:hypothetical protein [Gemmataceae bacterium]MCS7271511.1 hypothetical protein [Gemmataceae bacterium]MDW8244332.1 hypothetical protein [Thermogemmata sp.]
MMDAQTALQELEQRVRRLEEAVVRQETQEEAVVQKVLSRLKALAAERRPGLYAGDEKGVTVSLPPAAVMSLPPEPPPEGTVLPVPMLTARADKDASSNGPDPNGWSGPTGVTHGLWSWLQTLADLRLLLTMYFDPHYRVSRLTHFGLLALLGIAVFNYFFFAVWFNVLVVSPLLERLLLIIGTVIACKLLKLELVRYRRVREYINRWYNR